MKDYKELDLQALTWTQKGWGQQYELLDPEGEVVAELKRPHWWNRYAEVDAPGHRWSFEPAGFWRRRILVKSLGTGDQIAEFVTTGMYNGTLHL